MKTGETFFLNRLFRGSCYALLALSLTFGVSTVRADSETPALSLQDMVLGPIMDIVHAAEARIARLESTVALIAGSITSRQITAQELCIADQTGAQTCITKAQLDTLLGVMARTAAAEPVAVTTIVMPAVIEPAVVEPMIVETAVAEPAIVEPTVIEPAADEPVVLETVDRADASAVIPADAAAARDIVSSNDEPTTTGSLVTPTAGFAHVWHPAVETFLAASASAVE